MLLCLEKIMETGVFLGQNQSGHPEYTQRNLYYNGIRGALKAEVYHQGEKVDQRYYIKEVMLKYPVFWSNWY